MPNLDHSTTSSQTQLPWETLVSRPQPPRLLVPYLSLLDSPCIGHPSHSPMPLTTLKPGQHTPRAQNKCRLSALPSELLEWTPFHSTSLALLLNCSLCPFPPAILNHLAYPKHTLCFSILLCLYTGLITNLYFLLLFIACFPSAKLA